MAMDAHGRVFNVHQLADGKWINIKDCGGVAFLCYLAAAAGDTYTLQEATTVTGTSAQNLACITRWHTCTGDGSDTWTRRTQAAAATVVTTAVATQNGMVVEVQPEQLSAGFGFVKLTSTGAGLVTALLYDLKVQRRPANLPAITV
jgi:hypothetical protein